MTPGYDLYKRLPGLVLGFHGCDESVGKAVINGEHLHLKSIQNSYDWLGTGIYFWENDPLRALEFAEDAVRNKHLTAGKVTKPFVVGAVLDPGPRLNMRERSALTSVRAMFPEGEALFDGAGFQSKSHIQIAVRNPNCIKGYFRPML